jgi:hypothetical protein
MTEREKERERECERERERGRERGREMNSVSGRCKLFSSKKGNYILAHLFPKAAVLHLGLVVSFNDTTWQTQA